MRRLLVFLAMSLLSLPAVARDIYVSNVAGDDRNTGSAPQNLAGVTGPVRTIAKALRLATPGDRVVLVATGQPYRESISLVGSRNSGSAHVPFALEGNGAVLDGAVPVPQDLWNHYRDNIFRFRPLNMGPQQLFLDGKPPSRVFVRPEADSLPNLEPGQWCSHRGYIYFAVSARKLPRDYKLTYACLSTGITLYEVENVKIANLTIQGFRVDGVNVHSGGRSVVLSKVKATANGRNGVTVGGASKVVIDSCTLDSSGAAQLLTMPYGETQIYNSTLIGGAPGWVDQGGLVYLGQKRVRGGKEAIQPEDAPAPPEPPQSEDDGNANPLPQQAEKPEPAMPKPAVPAPQQATPEANPEDKAQPAKPPVPLEKEFFP